MTTLSPLLTIFKVRDPISNARNLTEAKLLEQRWQQKGIDIQYRAINFPSQEEGRKFYNTKGEYRPPLSWKLTQDEKDAIKDAWEDIKGEKQIQELKTLWRHTWKIN